MSNEGGGNAPPPQQQAPDTSQPVIARPSHLAYSVREASDGRQFFNRVGAAFPHRDGQGFNLDLEAFPVGGRVVLRAPWERLDEMKNGKTQQRETEGHEK